MWIVCPAALIAILCGLTIAERDAATGDRPVMGKEPATVKRRFPNEPIQLVRPDREHKMLEVIEENLSFLHQVPAPLAVVAVVGTFHSGKSFLMNQLMRKGSGFGVGPSVQPETMGIWMWGQPAHMTTPEGHEVNVIFLDTEGFAANNVSENYDSKVFAVATLLSSHLLFNSVKIINQADIDYLEVLARQTQLFALRSQMSESKWLKDFNQDLLKFPPLTWVVQDFYQTVEKSSRDWLHQLMRSHTREMDEYNISILDIFSEVDCHTLFLPATTEYLLNDLSKAREEDLTDKYRQDRDELRNKLSLSVKPKKNHSRFVTGVELAHLLKVLVGAANDGNLASVPSRMERFVEKIQSSATDDCLKFYEEEMAASLAAEGLDGIMKKSRFLSTHDQMTEKATTLMRQLLQGLNETLEAGIEKLANRIDLSFERMRDMNDKKIKLMINEILQRSQVQIEEAIAVIASPVPTHVYDLKTRGITEDFEVQLFSRILRFVDDQESMEVVSEIMKSLKRIIEVYKAKNGEEIKNFFSKAIVDAEEKVVSVFNSDWDQSAPLIPSILAKLKARAVKEAELIFTDQTKDFDQESLFVIMKSHLAQRLKEKDRELEDKNAELASHFVKQEAGRLMEQLKQRTSPDVIQMPVFDADLDKKLEHEVSQVLRNFETTAVDYSVYPSYATHLDNFRTEIASLCEKRKKENIDAFTLAVNKPLEAALKHIILAESNYNTVFSFKRFVSTLLCLVAEVAISLTVCVTITFPDLIHD